MTSSLQSQGFILIRGAVPKELCEKIKSEVWQDAQMSLYDRDRRESWPTAFPDARVGCFVRSSTSSLATALSCPQLVDELDGEHGELLRVFCCSHSP